MHPGVATLQPRAFFADICIGALYSPAVRRSTHEHPVLRSAIKDDGRTLPIDILTLLFLLALASVAGRQIVPGVDFTSNFDVDVFLRQCDAALELCWAPTLAQQDNSGTAPQQPGTTDMDVGLDICALGDLGDMFLISPLSIAPTAPTPTLFEQAQAQAHAQAHAQQQAAAHIYAAWRTEYDSKMQRVTMAKIFMENTGTLVCPQAPPCQTLARCGCFLCWEAYEYVKILKHAVDNTNSDFRNRIKGNPI